jgi:hypothetical protein
MNGAHEPVSHEADALASATIDCALTVHKVLGPGFLERAYDRAMQLEFARTRDLLRVTAAGIRDVPQHATDGTEGRPGRWRTLLVELKAAARLEPLFVSEVFSYLKATGLRLGPLINFNFRVSEGRPPSHRALSWRRRNPFAECLSVKPGGRSDVLSPRVLGVLGVLRVLGARSGDAGPATVAGPWTRHGRQSPFSACHSASRTSRPASFIDTP